jgi:hypothetical protein
MKMQKVQTPNGPAVIACSNKPVVFYINQRSIEMQYLSCSQLRSVCSLLPRGSQDKPMPLLIYEDARGVLQIGDIDGLQRL